MTLRNHKKGALRAATPGEESPKIAAELAERPEVAVGGRGAVARVRPRLRGLGRGEDVRVASPSPPRSGCSCASTRRHIRRSLASGRRTAAVAYPPASNRARASRTNGSASLWRMAVPYTSEATAHTSGFISRSGEPWRMHSAAWFSNHAGGLPSHALTASVSWLVSPSPLIGGGRVRP